MSAQLPATRVVSEAMLRSLSRAGVAVCVVASVAGGLVAASPAGAAAERVWLAPTDVAPGVGPQVAVDIQGRAVAVWGGDGVRSAERPMGGHWQAPVVLSPAGGAIHLAIGPRGAAAAIWSENPAGAFYHPYPSTAVAGAVRPAGGGWQARVEFGTASGVVTKERGLSIGQDVAVDPKGNAIAVWQFVGSIMGTVSAAGVWKAPVVLDSIPQDGPAPQVAVDGQGKAVAVWSTNEAEPLDRYAVRAAELAPGASWQSQQLSVAVSATTGTALDPQIAVNERGDAIAAWTEGPDYASGPATVQAAVRPAGASWQTPASVSAHREISGPRVTIDPRGNAIAVWVRVRGLRSVVQSASRPSGRPWSAPVNLSAYRRGVVKDPQVAFDGQGNAIAVWETPRGDHPYVQAAIRPSGAGWRSPVTLSGADAHAPQIAFGPAGDAIVVWSREKGRRSVIQAADYAVGPALSRLRASARTVTYTLNMPAEVRFRVERVRAGRQIGERCARPTRARRKRKLCVQYLRVSGALGASGSAGANRLQFEGRLAGRRLARGRYRLVATPRTGGRTGRSIRTVLRIAR